MISTIKEPLGALTGWLSTLAVFVDSDPFRGLLLTFWRPKAISMVVEPQVALTCGSSTFTLLADSGPFRGLLLPILWSRSDFHD